MRAAGADGEEGVDGAGATGLVRFFLLEGGDGAEGEDGAELADSLTG